MGTRDELEATLPLPGHPRVRRAASASLLLGRLLGPWRLEALAGEGSFGRVFRARHVLTGRVGALKVLHEALSGTSSAVRRFVEEACLSARVAHPAVVSAQDFGDGTDGGPAWAVARWVEGEPLSRVLRRGPLPLAQALWTGLGLSSALAAVHAAGVVHGDCKPDNVLLAADGGVHLVDFGCAWELGHAPRTVQGTPAYLAPELWSEGPLDARVDLYALGCVLFAALTGRTPFTAPDTGALLRLHRTAPPPPVPPRTARGEWIPAPLRALVAACLEKSPSARPGSALDLVRLLETLSQRA